MKEVSRGRGKGTVESSADNPGFFPGDHGGSKPGSHPHLLRNPQATFVLKVLSLIQDKAACHPTQRLRLQSPAAPGTHSPHSEVPGAASKTQELSGRPWTDADKGERPLLLSQETSRKAELLCREPGPTMTESHSLFLKTLDPK